MRIATRKIRCCAWSLLEVLVATGLGSMVVGTVASLGLYGTRSSMALANYTDLDAKSRFALDILSREVRQATAVLGTQNSAASKSLTLTNAFQSLLTRVSWRATTRTLVVERTGQAPLTALTECDRWDFSLCQRTPLVTPTNILFYPATNSSGLPDPRLCKLINMSWKCSRTLLRQKVHTESVQAAQLALRNKQ